MKKLIGTYVVLAALSGFGLVQNAGATAIADLAATLGGTLVTDLGGQYVCTNPPGPILQLCGGGDIIAVGAWDGTIANGVGAGPGLPFTLACVNGTTLNPSAQGGQKASLTFQKYSGGAAQFTANGLAIRLHKGTFPASPCLGYEVQQ